MLLKIRQERIEREWSQDYVSKIVGISPESIHYIETGQRKPSYDVLVKLLNLFGYDDPRKLFEAVENTKRPDGNQAE